MTTRRATRRKGITLAGIASITAGAILAVGGFAASPAGATDVTPTDVAGNPSCTDLGWPFEFKIEGAPANQEYDVTEEQSGVEGGGTVTISGAGVVDGVFYFDWSSTIAWDAVVVKQGNAAAVYEYDPESMADTDLHPSLTDEEPNGGISHISFCRDNISTTTTEEETTTTEEETTTTVEVTTTEQGTTTSETVLGKVITKTPAPQVQAEQLPRTGSGTQTMAYVGIGLILVGAGATILGSRREALV